MHKQQRARHVFPLTQPPRSIVKRVEVGRSKEKNPQGPHSVLSRRQSLPPPCSNASFPRRPSWTQPARSHFSPPRKPPTTHNHGPATAFNVSISQQVKVVQFVVVRHHGPLDLGAIHPRQEILLAPGHKEGRVGDNCGKDEGKRKVTLTEEEGQGAGREAQPGGWQGEPARATQRQPGPPPPLPFPVAASAPAKDLPTPTISPQPLIGPLSPSLSSSSPASTPHFPLPVGPTRTWPCSMKVTASFNVSAIFIRTITTGKRRRQKAEAARVSHWLKDFFVGIKPML